MCGIAGFVGPVRQGDTASILEGMLSSLRHRGPDDQGMWFEGPAHIGHRRLSIVDLSPAGHQPMLSAASRFVVAFNGEIYNHASLRKEIESAGERFRGHSDTEVLLALIERYGVSEACRRCVGMFAIAVWDRTDRVLYLMRDRVGEKPLYYSVVSGTVVFGSEIQAVERFPGASGEINDAAVADLLRLGYVAGQKSILHSVEKIPPASILKFKVDAQGKVCDVGAPEVYWDGDLGGPDGEFSRPEWSFEKCAQELDEILRAAISMQMCADVPLGAFLSGGVDSSLVVAIMQQLSSQRVRTYTIGFWDRRFNEAEMAKRVAAHLGTAHTELYVAERDALEVIPRLPGVYCEPLADSSQIPTILLSRLVRKDLTVALSGDGADELFGGYPKYERGANWASLGARRHVRRAVLRFARTIRPGAARLLTRGVNAKIRWHRLDTVSAFVNAESFAELADELCVVNREYRMYMARPMEAPASDVVGATRGRSYRRVAMGIDKRRYLPDDILVKVDRATMSASLESRAPFLDHRMCEFAAKVPERYLFSGGVGKRLLREVLYKYVPREFVDRPKAGFNVPMGAWLKGQLRGWAYDVIGSSAAGHVLNTNKCRELLDRHCNGNFDYSGRLWPILTLAAWVQHKAQKRETRAEGAGNASGRAA